MKTYYKHDLKKAYMILQGGEEDREDYQVVMLKENEIPGVLKVDVQHVDNCTQYYYDISGKTSFKMLHEKINLSLNEMKSLVNDLLQVLRNLQEYMLEAKCILLDPEYIFCEQENYFFCYHPFCDQDIKKEFHRLTEFFVREVNYRDEEGVRFAYTLHKATMEDNYSIEEIMKNFFFENEESGITTELPQVNYVERIENASLEESMVEERDDLWEPIKRFLERSKRRKRGYREEDL